MHWFLGVGLLAWTVKDSEPPSFMTSLFKCLDRWNIEFSVGNFMHLWSGKDHEDRVNGFSPELVPTCLVLARHMKLYPLSLKIWWKTITYGNVLVAFSVSIFPRISCPINFLKKKNCAYHMMLLSVSILSKNTIVILPLISVLLASLNPHGSYVNSIHS